MKSTISSISLQTLLVLPFLFPLISTTCYLPDGALAPGAYRCNNATSGASTCCEIGSICWSNGVCQKQTNGITDWIRLGCTDPTWSDPACLHACMDITKNAVGVRPCGGITGTSYCCDLTPGDPGNMSCCSTSADLFSVPAATVEATVLAVPVSTFVSSTGSSSSMPTSSMSSSATPASTAGSVSSTSTPPAAASTGSSSLSTGAQAGIGIGVSLGVISAASLGFFFFWRRRKTYSSSKGYSTNTSEHGYNSDPGQWSGTAYDGWNAFAEPKPSYGQQGQVWSSVAPAAAQPAGELDNTETRSPAELSSPGHEYHELETPRTR